MEKTKKIRGTAATVILTIVSVLWLYPIVLILFNSLKVESAISTTGVFDLPTAETWNGIASQTGGGKGRPKRRSDKTT